MRNKIKSLISIFLIMCMFSSNMLLLTVFAEEQVSLIRSKIGSVNKVTNLDLSLNISYNNTYYENILKPGEQLTLNLNAANTSASKKNVQFFVGMYNSSNDLIGTAIDEKAIEGKTAEWLTVTLTVPQDVLFATVYVWDTVNNDSPYIITEMGLSEEDHYGDALGSAVLVDDINKEISGSTNSADKYDYVEFVAPESGTYYFKCMSIKGIEASLYKNGTRVQKFTQAFSYSLEKDSVYTIIIGEKLGKYVMLVKDSPIDSNEEFDIYDFDMEMSVY